MYIRILPIILLFLGCKDEIHLPDEPLQGKINGKEWTMGVANAYLVSSDFKYKIIFLLKDEIVDNPCDLPVPTLPYVSVIMKSPFQGSYSIPLPIISESVKLHSSFSKNITATSGFIEVFDVHQRKIRGYMQAKLDTDNFVEGAFEVVVCN